jgi:hypothetical protein
MKHDWKCLSIIESDGDMIEYLETREDDEGYLYVEWKKVNGTNKGKFNIEYCPLCGMRAKKSRTVHSTHDNSEYQIKYIHKIINKNFLNSCEILIKEDLEDDCFQFCLENIESALRYLVSKRKEIKEMRNGVKDTLAYTCWVDTT